MKRFLVALLALGPTVSLGQQGAWEDAFDFGTPMTGFTMAVDLIHVPPNPGQPAKVLALSKESPDSRLWTPPIGIPPPGVFESADLPTYTFCGGHSALADGRVLVNDEHMRTHDRIQGNVASHALLCYNASGRGGLVSPRRARSGREGVGP